MKYKIELSKGHKFEGTQLTFLRNVEPVVSPNGERVRRVEVLCDCGKTKVLRFGNIGSSSKSCGCLITKTVVERCRTHGLTKTKAYKSYIMMKRRCYNPKDDNYRYYGGRGIKMCDRWLDKDKGVTNFIEDMGQPEAGLSLDRIDSNGDYSPENCKWSSSAEQAYNRRRFKSNKTGRTGVTKTSYSTTESPIYQASISYGGEQYYLLCTPSLEEAIKAREDAEIKFYGKIKSTSYENGPQDNEEEI